MKRTVSVISTAEEANAAHRRIVATVQDAIAIGEFLTRQKAKLKHSEWLLWVKENPEFSRQTADNYRRLYENRDKLPSLSNLSLWNAYALTNGEKRSDSKYASDFAMNFVASCSFNLLKQVIVLVLWFDATFVLIARAALQVEDYKLAIGSRTCFSMESIKRRSRWGESALEPLADLMAIGSNIKLSDVVT